MVFYYLTQNIPIAVLIPYTIAFFALLIASYTDLRTREVPDWLSYGLIFSGLGLRLLYSLTSFDWNIFLRGAAGFAVFVAIAYLMYYTGQWGGGDSKLLMGLGALIGLDFLFFPLPALGIFFINLLLAGALYGLAWIVILAAIHFNKFKNETKKLMQRTSKTRMYVLVLSILLFVIVLIFPQQAFFKTALLVLAVMPAGTFYLWISVKAVENIAFYKRVHPTQLTEGDWIVRNIIIDGKKIAGPRDLGIDQEQIAKLIHYHSFGKIDKILIKEGIPFVPSFLIAFVITLVFGNWLGFFI